MKVLIIGGTGFIGPFVARRLCEGGYEITLFHRGKTKTDLPHGVREILGDRDAIADLADTLLRLAPDIILDMIPITELNAQVLMQMFDGIAERIVTISSQDVYLAYGVMTGIEKDGIQKVPLTEESPLRKKIYPYRGERMRADNDPLKYLDYYDKILVERIVMDSPGLPCTVLRLPMVYGPGDGQHRLYQYIKRMDDKRPVIILEEGLAEWRWTRGYVENIADAIVLAVMSNKAMNRIYNVGEPDALTMAEWIDNIARIAGWNGKILRLPKDNLPNSLAADFNTGQHLVTDSGLIRMELGYGERVRRDMAILRTVEWERRNPPGGNFSGQFDYKAEDEFLDTLSSRSKD